MLPGIDRQHRPGARLDERAIEVDSLSVHTPDLDDVFLALTGTNKNGKVFTS